MLKLSDYLRPETVFELGQVTRTDALTEVVEYTLAGLHPQQQTRAREQLRMSGAETEVDIGDHVVLSHVRLEGIDGSLVGAGYRPAEAHAGTLFVFVAVPEVAAREYLRLLARLARWATEVGAQPASGISGTDELLAAVRSFDEKWA